MVVKRVLEYATLGVLFATALFAVSTSFVNEEVTPKWFGVIIAISFVGVLWNIRCKDVHIPTQPIFLLMVACVVIVIFQDVYVSGINYELLIRSGSLLLLLYLLIQMTKNCSTSYLFGVITALALGMVVYGILQYTGIFSSLNHNFKITGSFDNPAGFGAALSFTLPYVAYFIHKTIGRNRYILIVTFMIILLGIILSGSRAAVISCLIVVLCSCFSGIKFRRWMSVAIAIVLIASVAMLYFIKKDSANGRLLIWQNTWNMANDSPIVGHGHGAFQAKYMLYQADYFATNPDSRYVPLADNVLYPFNEYLLVFAEHGIMGIGALFLLVWLLIRNYRRSPNFIKFTAGLSLLAVAVFSCFSYPFKYPFTWLIVLLNITLLCADTGTKTITGKVSSIFRIGITTLYTLLAYACFPIMKAEMHWAKTAKQSLAGKTFEMLPEYDKLYSYLGKSGLFLYNHAAELNHIKMYEESLQVFKECTKYYNDMDVQMLMAYNYKELEKYTEAEQHLKLAANMCPGRFIPLYELAKLYNTTNRKYEALAMAKIIINKDIKIPSGTIVSIKTEMKQWIEAFDKPKNNNQTNNELQQGETSQDTALPP